MTPTTNERGRPEGRPSFTCPHCGSPTTGTREDDNWKICTKCYDAITSSIEWPPRRARAIKEELGRTTHKARTIRVPEVK